MNCAKSLKLLVVVYSDDDSIITETEETILKKAYALSSSLPRQAGRNKWREKSGFTPNMLPQESSNGVLLKGDLLFFYNIDSIEYYVVEKDFKLIDGENKVDVHKIGEEIIHSVNVDRFVYEKGMISVVPIDQYSILEDSTVVFHDPDISVFLEDLMHKQPLHSEEDWV